jgi:hypothetical protein
MKKIGSVAVVAAMAAILTVTIGGSANAGVATSRVVSPATPATWKLPDSQNDFTGCGATHQMSRTDMTAP